MMAVVASRGQSVVSWLGLVSVLAAALAVGCGNSSQTPACKPGMERCDCYGNGTCNTGLECRSNLCVSAAAGGASGSTAGRGGSGAAGTTGAAGSGSGGSAAA